MEKIKKITIYLGSKCNLNCAYCHREPDKNEHGITDDLLKLIDDYQPQEIRFLGGEPTLYMDDIKKIVAHYPRAKFAVTTNGVLLAQYIDYFREHNFRVTVSFDGGAENLRGFEPLQQAIDYHDFSVSTTLTHGNTNFDAILRRFAAAEKRIGRLMMFFPHIAHHTNVANETFALTKDDVKDLLESYREAIYDVWYNYARYGVINMRYKAIFSQLWIAYNANYELGETYCSNGHSLKVDASGKKFNCSYVRNTSPEQNRSLIMDKFPECASCEYYSCCGSACVQSLSHDVECAFYKGLYSMFKNFIANVPPKKLEQLVRCLQC